MTDLATRLSAVVGAGRVSVVEASSKFAHDESDVGRFVPDVVVEAVSAEEIEAVVKVARELKAPVVPRGAGTGKVGGALAWQGGVVLDVARMQRIVEIDPVDLVAVVQPGVVLGTFQEAVEAQGLFYPPDPNSQATCTLGGNVAHDAGGPRALKYGVTREWVQGLDVVLGTGERVRTGHRSRKGVAGLDLTALLIGSEGTLGVFTELMLRVMPKPPAVETALAVFSGATGEAQALAAVNGFFAAGLLPRTCEFLDSAAIRAVARVGPFRFPEDVSAALVVEVDGTPEACAAELAIVGRVAVEQGAADVLLARSESERRQVWETRRMVSPALRAIRPLKISEDVAVPRSQLLPMVKAVREIGAAHGLETAAYGHAGDGNLHVNLLFESRADAAKVESAIAAVMKAALGLGGTISGEHGIGLAKKRFLGWEQSGAVIAAQRRVKAALDPDGIMNPGKVWPEG